MDEHHVCSIIEDYFKNLFTFEGPRDWGDILAFVPAVILDDINATLLAPISNEEIQSIVFQMGALKLPGPYGFFEFFTKNTGALWEMMCASWSTAYSPTPCLWKR